MQAYQNSLKLIPEISGKSDIYQFGLIILELLFGRFWSRGDKIDMNEINTLESNNCLPDVKSFLVDKAEDFVR